MGIFSGLDETPAGKFRMVGEKLDARFQPERRQRQFLCQHFGLLQKQLADALSLRFRGNTELADIKRSRRLRPAKQAANNLIAIDNVA